MFGSNPLGLTRFASGLNAVLGAWIVITPWFFGHAASTDPLTWAHVLSGAVIGLLGTARWMWPTEAIALSWLNLFLGGWLALLPWTLQFIDLRVRAWNCVIVGLCIMMFAGWSMAGTKADRVRQQV